jgi:signal peptidase I
VDPLAYKTPPGGPRPDDGTALPARPVRRPIAVPELPAGLPFLATPRPAGVPELPADQWPPWLAPPRRERRRSDRPAPRRGRWVLEWAIVLVVAVVLAVGVRTYVAQMFYIPSGSMLPTLQIGDRIVVDKLSYHFHAVDRGDIVVFRRPPLELANYSDLVKRVIGLPGDTIASVDGRIMVNGRFLAEPWLPNPPPETLPSPLSAPYSLNHPYRVPAGDYYVMGDNRTDSEDSRYFGPIPRSLIVGKMAFKAWPLTPTSWAVALAVVVVGLALMVVVFLRTPARRRPEGRARGRSPPIGATPGPG